MAQNKMVDAKQFSILPFIGKHNVPSKSSYASKLKPSLVRRGAGQAGVRISSTISPISSDSSSRTKRTTNTSMPSARVPRLKVRGASGKERLSARVLPARGGNLSLSPSFASNVPTRRNSKDGFQRSGRPSMDFMRKSRHRSKILKDTSETVLESYDIQPSPSPSFPLIGKLQDMPFADIKKFIEDIASPLFHGPQSVSSSFLTAPELEVHLEDMSAKAMKRLEYVFKVAEERDGPLTYDTFRSVLHAVLGHRVAEKELKIMFMKIDTNCDETVSWSEYLSFILCELQKKDLMRSTKNDNPLPDEISSTIHSRHHNFITRIRFTPALLNRGSRNEKWDKSLGKYISLSLDGTVCFWSQKMECKRVHSLHQSRVAAPIYCTDLVAMANINYIAVSTSQSDIRFYELSGQHRFEKVMTVSHHKHLVLCMHYWFDEANMDKARLFWGDAGGNVFILTFWKCIDGGPFGNVSSSKNISLGQLLADVQCGQKNRYHVHKLKRLHLDWVRAIRYVPELDAVVSSCGETTTAMACTALHDMKSKLFVVHKGVICFDYSNNQNLLVSGGIEQNVRGWNPYINTGPIFRLKGTNAVVHLMVNNERDLCISISLDKNVSIFSLKDQTLVQLIPPRSFPKMIGHKPITSAYFNNDTQVLVVGTTDLSVFLPDLEREVSLRSNTHESDLCGVLFNPLYDLIVSGSVGSSVCVWDARTGEKKLMFDKAHVATLYNKETVIDLTAMSFDYTKRRLVTGGRDGTVKIWNFHNGDCLQVMETQGQMEKNLILIDFEWEHGSLCEELLIRSTGLQREKLSDDETTDYGVVY